MAIESIEIESEPVLSVHFVASAICLTNLSWISPHQNHPAQCLFSESAETPYTSRRVIHGDQKKQDEQKYMRFLFCRVLCRI